MTAAPLPQLLTEEDAAKLLHLCTRSLRRQSEELGRVFNFKQVGGRTSEKGGHELDGKTYFDRPLVSTPNQEPPMSNKVEDGLQGLRQDQGASLRDRAVTADAAEPKVSALRVSIPCADKPSTQQIIAELYRLCDGNPNDEQVDAMWEAAAKLEWLLVLLEGRDKFIVDQGMWSEFVEQIPMRYPVGLKRGETASIIANGARPKEGRFKL